MITLSLSPLRCDKAVPVVRVEGETILIDGEQFDFSPLPNGGALPASAVQSDWFIGEIERIEGSLHVTLMLPHGPNPSEAVAFPELIIVTSDGPVALPFDPAPEPVAPELPLAEVPDDEH